MKKIMLGLLIATSVTSFGVYASATEHKPTPKANFNKAQVKAPEAISSKTVANDNGNFKAGDLLVRLRAVDVIPQESAKTSVIGGDVSISTEAIPELDFTYFFTNKIAAELVLGTSNHSVTAKNTSSGALDLGSVWLLPPTLTAQYHFETESPFKPYLGAGVNYTMFYGENKSKDISSIKYENSFGPALQAGFDYALGNNWYFNMDLKKVWLNSKVKINGGSIVSDVDIDPLLLGLGIGYKF